MVSKQWYPLAVRKNRPRTAAPAKGWQCMDYEIRYVGGHVEVYSMAGAFLFSADTAREAMEEMAV